MDRGQEVSLFGMINPADFTSGMGDSERDKQTEKAECASKDNKMGKKGVNFLIPDRFLKWLCEGKKNSLNNRMLVCGALIQKNVNSNSTKKGGNKLKSHIYNWTEERIVKMNNGLSQNKSGFLRSQRSVCSRIPQFRADPSVCGIFRSHKSEEKLKSAKNSSQTSPCLTLNRTCVASLCLYVCVCYVRPYNKRVLLHACVTFIGLNLSSAGTQRPR